MRDTETLARYAGRTMSWWSTSERGYERGYFSTFHCFTRVDLEIFWGLGCVWVCVWFVFVWFGVVVLFSTFSRSF